MAWQTTLPRRKGPTPKLQARLDNGRARRITLTRSTFERLGFRAGRYRVMVDPERALIAIQPDPNGSVVVGILGGYRQVSVAESGAFDALELPRDLAFSCPIRTEDGMLVIDTAVREKVRAGSSSNVQLDSK